MTPVISNLPLPGLSASRIYEITDGRTAMLETIALTVFFEGPFWVCVLERSDGKTLSAAKATFGAEPKDPEVLEFVCTQFRGLKFSDPVAHEKHEHSRPNPKRMRQQIEKAVNSVGVGTKSQQALKAQYELNKQEHKSAAKHDREATEKLKFELRRAKRKTKHKGR